MGFREAVEDGIRYNDKVFEIPCTECKANIVKSFSYSRKRNYVCDTCKRIAKGKLDSERMLEKEIKYRNAVSRIEMMVDNPEEYREAMEKVHSTLHHSGWYGSTEEIMVAIELLRNGVRTIHQQKVGRYRVDFVLPDYKVLLEVDGMIFHNNYTLEKEGIRDGKIVLAMGVDWEMIRIDTDKINKDIQKLLPSIETILKHRQAAKQRINKA